MNRKRVLKTKVTGFIGSLGILKESIDLPSIEFCTFSNIQPFASAVQKLLFSHSSLLYCESSSDHLSLSKEGGNQGNNRWTQGMKGRRIPAAWQ